MNEISEISQTTSEEHMESRDNRTESHDDHLRQDYDKRKKSLKEILDRPIFHHIFLLCCVVAASLDPLFFYIPIINDQKKCLRMDEKLKKTILVLRSVMDLTYIFHITFQIFSWYIAYASETGEKVIDRIRGAIWMINWWIIIIDILCVLPIPQMVILVYFAKMKVSESLNWRKILSLIILFQFVPKIFRIYHSCKKLTKNRRPLKIVRATWVKGLFNFFLYIIATQLFGALWYLFSVERELECWQQACKGNSMCNQSTFLCKHRYDIVDDPIIGYLNLSCSWISPSRFDFGMFTPALQSRIVNSKDFPKKFFYCFAWGLRNLSSFGSNLQTSTNFWESLFSVAITVIGLLLFIYLIGNLQTYLQFSANYSEKRRKKMEKKEGEIDKWIRSNEIPQDMGKELKDCVSEKMDQNKDVNLKNLLNVLPTQSKQRMKQRLCLPVLNKVPRLQEMRDKSIHKIFIDRLKPVIFNENTKIFKEGEPLSRMLFFTQGSADVYSTAYTNPVELKKGGFYGEELLDWALADTPSQALASQAPPSQATSSAFPISQKTVKTNTKVEAFALEAPDMKIIAKFLPSSRKETNQKDKEEVDSSRSFIPHFDFVTNYRQNLRRKMEEIEGETDTWININEIPQDMGKELKDLVRQKMHENKNVNLKNLFNVLPTQSKKRIKQHMCLPILKKVPRLQEMNDRLIDEIFIDLLKPVIFTSHTKIFKKGDPLSQMLFFTQGSAWAYTKTDDTTHVMIERGDFYGEELLEWALTGSSSPVPTSQKTVKTSTEVEAFAVDVQDMKKIAKSWPSSRKETNQKDEEGVGSSSSKDMVFRRMGQFMGNPRQKGLKKDNKDSSESGRV